jgi:DNA-binding NarL/FixJ family response regulator
MTTKSVPRDLAVVDIAMPQLNGLDAGEQLKKQLPKVKLLYVSMHFDADIAAEAFRRGGSGYLPKTCSLFELKTAVVKVLKGERYLSPLIARDSVRGLVQSHAPLVDDDHRLSGRQKQVLQLLVEGRGMKEVANALHIAPRTVAFHKYRIMGMLKVNNDADLVRYALRQHLIAA